jgi:hypothetical protein
MSDSSFPDRLDKEESILPPPPEGGNESFDLRSQPLYEKPLPEDGDEEPSISSSADSSPIPPKLVEINPLSIIPRALEILNDPTNTISASDTAFLGTRHRLKAAIGLDPNSTEHDVLVLRLLNIFKYSPEEPENGFEHVFHYGLYVKELNRIMAYFHALAAAEPERYRLRDPNNPDKFRGHFYMECADGRNSLVPFKNPARVLNIFDTEWLPSAGTILFSEVDVPKNSDEIMRILDDNPELKEKIFARMEFLYGNKLQQLLADYDSEDLSTIWFEYQAHFDGEHFPHHGCGAHCSDLAAAQLETLKNCFLTEAWLKEKYPRYFEKGAFKVFRTCHDTGEGKPIYTGSKIDEEKLDEDKKGQYADSLAYAHDHFEAPHLFQKDQGIVRRYYGNPMGIEMAEHDEQTIKISNLHFASTLMGQSVLEISWTDDVETLYQHVKVLLSIIDKNFRSPKAWAKRAEDEKAKAKRLHKKSVVHTKIPPAILHFDLIKGDAGIESVFNQLKAKLLADNEIADRIDNGSLQLIATVTDPVTYKLRNKI